MLIIFILFALFEVFIAPRLMVKWNKKLFFDLYKKEFMKKLIDNSIFDYAVLLAGSKAPGMIKEIRSLKHD